MPPRKIVNEQEVIRWFEENRTYTWMQEEYRRKYGIETTIPMWSAFRRRRGIDRRHMRASDLLPWRMKDEHRHLYPAMMLRAEARERAGRGVTGREETRLAAWRTMLKEENLVVHYDADTEEGFFYVPREEGDTDIIREPPQAKRGNKPQD
ncbi:hypothetical protein [Actinacidiphila glaucinigra]|uniref:Immunity repressor n=1 Tax=Actinacidiphila glaucinigra TaxID=235986 RepID=A0A239F2G2_9ACTN|nr:hypothetical protein [Actinacidiphila glaucinigra]SNS50738.1 hypothetical protein SAMN05216252_106264 [Actinacidiphila glaucinigra]